MEQCPGEYENQQCECDDGLHAVGRQPFAAYDELPLQSIFGSLPGLKQWWPRGENEQHEAGEKEQRLERSGLVTNLDVMMAGDKRDRSEIGRNAQEGRALPVDPCNEARMVGDFDEGIAEALSVDAGGNPRRPWFQKGFGHAEP